MQKLCFGTFLKILNCCAAPTTTEKVLCGKLLLTINSNYDIKTDSTTTSKLKNGYSNLSSDITEKIVETNPYDIANRLREDFLPLLDSNRYVMTVTGLLMILEEDKGIRDEVEIDKLHHKTKANLLVQNEFVFEELIAGLLVYVSLYTDNIGANKYVKEITPEYLEDSYRMRPRVKIVDKYEEKTFDEKTNAITSICLREGDAKVFKIAALVGSWHDGYEADRTVPEKYFKINENEYSDRIMKCQRLNGSIFSHKDKVWKFCNHKDILIKISEYIFDDDVDELFDIASTFFMETNQKCDSLLEQILIANVSDNGDMPGFSNYLKKSVLESIAIICNNEKSFINCSYERIKTKIRIYEHKLFSEKDWKFYAYIEGYIDELAEACPDVFLERLLDLLESQDESSLKYLQWKEFFSAEQKLCYQLSATLRRLAVSEIYFAKTMLVLTKLAKYCDLFLNTMVTIVLPWRPQTNADIKVRTGIFKGLAKENVDIIWKVLMKLMPNVTISSFRILIPNYMYEPVLPTYVSQKDSCTATEAYVLIAISLINGKTDRIIDMIDLIDDVPENLQDEILKSIHENSLSLSNFEKERVWNKKENFIMSHRRFAAANGGLDEKKIKHINDVLDDLWIDTNEYVLIRLFVNDQFSLMECGENWNEEEEKLQKKQIYEVTNLYKNGGIKEILTLENKVENKRLLGKTLACVLSKNDLKLYLLERVFDLKSKMVLGLLETVDRKWIFEIADSAEPKTAVKIMSLVFVDDEIITRVLKFAESAQKIYFENLSVNGLSEISTEHLLFLLDGVSRVGRIDAWIEVMYNAINHFKKQPDEKYLMDGLLGIDVDSDFDLCNRFKLRQLLKHVQDNCINHDKLLELEWKYLNIFDEKDGFYPVSLWNELIVKPKLFIELIKNLAENTSEFYSRSYELLYSWKKMFSRNNNRKSIDCNVLNNWFLEVKRMALDENVIDFAMNYCGRLFFYMPEDESGFFINLGIAEIIDCESNTFIRSGYVIEAINSRGCYVIDLTGRDDFEIEENYKEKARASEAEGFIRLADCLRSIANSYHEDGLIHQHLHDN